MLTIESYTHLPIFTNQLQYHSAVILFTMNQHRQNDTKLCDICIEINQKQYPLHRSLLAACSPYFLAMFNGNMKESTEKHVILKDIDENIFELIIDYIYTSELNVTIENVEDLLKLATQLQFAQVCEIAYNFLEKQLEPTNCINIRKFATIYHCKEFLKTVDQFICKHFQQVACTEEFVFIPFQVLKDILSSNNLNIDCEERVFNIIIKWVKHDLKGRESYLCELLSVTKLPLISKHYLMSVIENESLVKNSLPCRDLLDEAKNYYLQPENHSALRSIRTIPRWLYAGTMFAVGGKEAGEIITKKAECYSMYSSKWTQIASLSQPRQQLGVCEFKNNIFAIAGSDGVTRTDTVEIYVPEKNIWLLGPHLQTCRSGVVACSMGNAIYALGGYDGHFCVSSVEICDPVQDTWEYGSPTKLARSFPGVACLNQRLYVIGGNDGSAFLDSCECYDPIAGKWSYIAPMSTTRAGVGCSVLDGLLYVAGGFDGIGRSNLVEVYDPRMNAWREVSSMKYSRDGCCMTSYGGYLYVIGGIDGPSYLSTVEYYDPLLDEWEEAPPMRTPRAAAGVAVVLPETIIDF